MARDFFAETPDVGTKNIQTSGIDYFADPLPSTASVPANSDIDYFADDFQSEVPSGSAPAIDYFSGDFDVDIKQPSPRPVSPAITPPVGKDIKQGAVESPVPQAEAPQPFEQPEAVMPEQELIDQASQQQRLLDTIADDDDSVLGKMRKAWKRGRLELQADIDVGRAVANVDENIPELLADPMAMLKSMGDRTLDADDLERLKPLVARQIAQEGLDPIEGGNKLATGVYEASRMMGGMWETIARSWDDALAGAAVGAKTGSAALAAGAIPGALGISAGTAGGFTLGGTIGTAKEWYFQGAGQIYRDMIADGLDKDTSKNVALVGAVPYAAAEFVASRFLGGLITPKQLFVGKMTKKTFANGIRKIAMHTVKEHLKQTGGEIFEEGVQEMITDTSKRVGTYIHNLKWKDTKEAIDTRKTVENSIETMIRSALPIALTMSPSASFQFSRNAMRLQEQKSLITDADKQQASLSEQFGQDNVTRISPTELSVVTPQGTMRMQFEEDLTKSALENPEGFLESISSQGKRGAEAVSRALKKANNDVADATDILMQNDEYAPKGKTVANAEITDEAGNTITVDQLISLETGFATGGTAQHEIWHALKGLMQITPDEQQELNDRLGIDPALVSESEREEIEAYALENYDDRMNVGAFGRVLDFIDKFLGGYKEVNEPLGQAVERVRDAMLQRKQSEEASTEQEKYPTLTEEDKVLIGQAIEGAPAELQVGETVTEPEVAGETVTEEVAPVEQVEQAIIPEQEDIPVQESAPVEQVTEATETKPVGIFTSSQTNEIKDMSRSELIARAKELGVDSKGKNQTIRSRILDAMTVPWKTMLAETDDVWRKGSILEAVANSKASAKELEDAVEILNDIKDDIGSYGANIAWAIMQNPRSSQQSKEKAEAIRELFFAPTTEETAPVEENVEREATQPSKAENIIDVSKEDIIKEASKFNSAEEFLQAKADEFAEKDEELSPSRKMSEYEEELSDLHAGINLYDSNRKISKTIKKYTDIWSKAREQPAKKPIKELTRPELRAKATELGVSDKGGNQALRKRIEGATQPKTETKDELVGKDVRVQGFGNQSFEVVKKIPQTEIEAEAGEQFYEVRNKKTKEVESVLAEDINAKAKTLSEMSRKEIFTEAKRLGIQIQKGDTKSFVANLIRQKTKREKAGTKFSVSQVALRPQEQKYIQGLLDNKANRAELLEEIPSLKLDGNSLTVSVEDVDNLVDFLADTYTAERSDAGGEGVKGLSRFADIRSAITEDKAGTKFSVGQEESERIAQAIGKRDNLTRKAKEVSDQRITNLVKGRKEQAGRGKDVSDERVLQSLGRRDTKFSVSQPPLKASEIRENNTQNNTQAFGEDKDTSKTLEEQNAEEGDTPIKDFKDMNTYNRVKKFFANWFSFGELFFGNTKAYESFIRTKHALSSAADISIAETNALIKALAKESGTKVGKLIQEGDHVILFALEEKGGREKLDARQQKIYDMIEKSIKADEQAQKDAGVFKFGLSEKGVKEAINHINTELASRTSKKEIDSKTKDEIRSLKKSLDRMTEFQENFAGYVSHVPIVRKFMELKGKARADFAKRLELFVRQREGKHSLRDFTEGFTDSHGKFREAILSPADLNPIQLMAEMKGDAYKRIATTTLVNEMKAAGYIQKGFKGTPDQAWLDASQIKGISQRGLKDQFIHPLVAGALAELSESNSVKKNGFRKLLAITKVGQFFVPGIVLTYDIMQGIQRGMWSANPIKQTKYIIRAFNSVKNQDQDWQTAHKFGLGQKPSIPTIAAEAELYDQLGQSVDATVNKIWKFGSKAVDQKLNLSTKEAMKDFLKNPIDAMMLPYRSIGKVTWMGDDMIRMISYHAMKDLYGDQMTPERMADYAAKAHGAYALPSKQFKDVASLIFFVHTFRLLMPWEHIKTHVTIPKMIYNKVTQGKQINKAEAELAAKALTGTLLTPLAVFMMMTANGWKPDDEGLPEWWVTLKKGTMQHWKFKKTVRGQDGKKRELVTGINTILNMPTKWVERAVKERPEKLNDAWYHVANMFKWEVNPMYRNFLDIATNESSMGGTRPYQPGDSIGKQVLSASKYFYDNTFRMYGEMSRPEMAGAYQRQVKKDLEGALNGYEKVLLGYFTGYKGIAGKFAPLQVGYTYSRRERRARLGSARQALARAISAEKGHITATYRDRPDIRRKKIRELVKIQREREKRLRFIFLGDRTR